MSEENPKWLASNTRLNSLYERGNDIRSNFERDYTRLLHCQAYRRLKHKTQVFYATTNDHVCTRMEHVGHVASVSSTIAKYLGLNEQLTQAIALGHDIGHAPFGHHGETCLNKILQPNPGHNEPKKFWHERNSLFFADYIETLQDPNYIEKPLDLTYAVRDGLICHCGEVDEEGLRPRSEAFDLYEIKRAGSVQPYTWEGCVVKISDKIAFLGRDIEDARTSHILDMGSYRQLREIVGSTLGFDALRQKGIRSGKAINTTVLINDLIMDLCTNSSPEKGLCFSEKYFRFITEIKKFSNANIYSHWRLMEFQQYATLIIETIYRTLMRVQPFLRTGRIHASLRNCPNLAETFEDWLIKYTNYRPDAAPDRKKILKYNTQEVFDIYDNASYQKCIIEYISGMTDNYAITVYNEIITF